MPNRVFNRSIPGGHPFDPALDQWLSRHPPDDYRALACNLVHDHRVTPERQEVLLRYFAAAAGTPEERLEGALKNYLDKEIRLRKRPAFLVRRTNSPNLFPDVSTHFGRVSGPRGSRSRQPSSPPQRDLWLARVLDLNGLVPVYLLGRHHRIRLFRDFPRTSRHPANPRRYSNQVLTWLDEHLAASADRQKEFMEAVLDALEISRKSRPYQPSWATYWTRFRAIAGNDPERWTAVLGMPNWRSCPRWLIVLRYRLRETGGLVRPTTLEAGLNAFHFPSPPQAPLHAGGHPVDLQLTPRPDSLLPEFIHQQIPHSFQHWKDSGFLLGRTDLPRTGALVRRRHNHHVLLRSVYGDEVEDWMRRST